MARPKRPPPHDGVIAWTRCKFPIDQRIPDVPSPSYPKSDDVETLRSLAAAPGYEGHVHSGRGVDHPDEILFVTRKYHPAWTSWYDEASANAFMLSPGYADYLKTFGFDGEHSNTEYGPAFVVLDREHTFAMVLRGLATIFTVGFAYPIPPDAPSIDGVKHLRLSPSIATYHTGIAHLRCRGWIVKPQVVGGHLVKKGVVVQSWNNASWTRGQKIAVYQAVDRDVEARKEWSLQVEALNPLYVDEATWNFSDEYDDEDDEEVARQSKIELPELRPYESRLCSGRSSSAQHKQ